MKQKMKQLMGILISLVMVLEGAGGLTVCAAEQTEPNAIEQRLQIDDVIYYNAKSRSFASSTQQFYYDLLSAPVDDSKYGWAYQFSRAELWMYLALCLDPGCPDRDLLYMESEIRGHELSPLKYIYNNGKDEFYTGIWYNGRHYDVVFRNLGIVALQPDASVKGNYISTTIDSSKSGGTHVSSVRNESNSYVTQTIDDSESVTVTMSNSVNGSESYSYTEGIKVGYEYDGIFNNVSADISFSATQALQNGWSKSNTESKTYTNGTSNTRTVPPYSAAVMETGYSDIEVTTRYNCLVGLTYSVDILTGGTNDWNPDTDPNATTWNGKKYTFGPDARKDIYQRWLINGNSSTNVDREKIDWRWVGYGRRGISDNQWLIVPLSKYVPVSSAGAVIRETKNSTKTTCKEFVPLHPLKTIKIETPPDGTAIAGKISYDSYDYLQMSLPMGKSSYTRYFTLGGYNSQGGIFSTFNKDFGHWIVVDENGRELGGDAPVTLDSATGKFTAASPGKCYLKYLIDEDKYVSADTGERYLTNRDIDKPAIMEITVEEPEYTNKLEITGSYTGIVGMAPESIEGDGKLQGAVLDETDAEVEEPYIWKARQLPSRGINLTEDGTVSFTKPGTFQVRIMTPDKKHYSEWYDVTAKRGDDSSYIIIDDDDLPPVIDDEDYRIADESAVIFVEGSFDGSANGEAVSLEGKDKLTVYAEDLSGQELPIKYEWEQMENEGLVLSKDGKAVFTKPGNYFVRVRSGEIYSDWVEITAKVPAEVKRAPVAIDRVFDGRTRNLVEPGVAVGGKIAYVVMIDPWSVPSEANFEEEWASEIPAATDVGTYYVWYKAVGDENHSDSEPKPVTVVIAEPAGSETGNTETKPGAPTISGSNMADVVKSVVAAIQNGTLKDAPANIGEIKAAIGQPGAIVTLTLVSTPLADNEIPAQDKNALDRVMQTSGYDGYAAFDLSLLLTVKNPATGETVTEYLHASSKEVTFTLNVPDNLKKEGRTFFLLHTANGITNVVGSAQNPGPLNGRSSNFSTYAIAYKDAVATERFTFKKVWMGSKEDKINFKVYYPDGKAYDGTVNKDKVTGKKSMEWTFDLGELPVGCYVVEEPVAGYTSRCVNVGEHAADRDRCYNGGTIINKKIPKTGDEEPLLLWAGMIALGAVGLTATLVIGKKRKVHK